MEGFALLFIVSAVIFGLVTLVLTIWALIHCIKNQDLTDTNRLIYVILILVLGIIGVIIYMVAKPAPSRSSGRGRRRPAHDMDGPDRRSRAR